MNSCVINDTKKLFSIKNIFWLLALTVFFAVNMNVDWRSGYLAWYGSLALVVLAYFLAFDGRIIFKGLSFELWLLSFIGLGFISLLWSLSVSMGMDVIKNLIVYLAVLFLIHSAINHGFEIDIVLKCYFVATLVNVVYIVGMIDLTALGETQLGTHMLEGWNGNGIGFLAAQGVLLGYYLIKKTEKKMWKVFFLACVLGLAVLTMYTGSRTAFIMLIAELILCFWLGHPTKMVRNVMITLLVLVGAFYLVMNVESFYNVLGSRLEGLFALFSGEGKVDSSASIRDTFIENGKKWFAEEPIFGYGINNYKVLNNEATGRFTYSHNTFIDIAVGLGTIGLIWYYSAYAYLMVRLVKLFKNNLLNIVLLSALVVSFLSHYGTVCYYGFYQNLLLLLCFWAVNNTKKESAA